jgi:hypothetical protein
MTEQGVGEQTHPPPYAGQVLECPIAARAQQLTMPVIGFLTPATSAEQLDVGGVLAAFRTLPHSAARAGMPRKPWRFRDRGPLLA